MLRKTTILPTDDPALASSMLREHIHDQPHVLMIVLGSGAEAQLFAERADKMTGAPSEPRWVAWARDPAAVRKVLDELKASKSLQPKLAQAFGLALSLTDTVRDVIEGPAAPDLLRIYKAFKKAEGDLDA